MLMKCLEHGLKKTETEDEGYKKILDIESAYWRVVEAAEEFHAI